MTKAIETIRSIKMTKEKLYVPCKWATSNDRTFFPRVLEKEKRELPPGVYTICMSPTGLYFNLNKPVDLSELIRFDDCGIDEAVSEIKDFWTKKSLFERHDFAFRRGILLYGPPGSGKSCAIKMIIQDVINDGGIAIMFTGIEMLNSGMDVLRDIQPETKVVIVMEDLDSWLDRGYEPEITDMLDGHNSYNNIVFLATTNYINNLSDRIKNRPSRFDKRIYVGTPNEKTRREYLINLLSKSDFKDKVNINEWANDSNGLTFAHLKELYLSTCFFGAKYNESLNRLKSMVNDDDEEVEDEFNKDIKSLIKKHVGDKYDDDDDDDPPSPPPIAEVSQGNY